MFDFLWKMILTSKMAQLKNYFLIPRTVFWQISNTIQKNLTPLRSSSLSKFMNNSCKFFCLTLQHSSKPAYLVTQIYQHWTHNVARSILSLKNKSRKAPNEALKKGTDSKSGRINIPGIKGSRNSRTVWNDSDLLYLNHCH